MKFIFLIFSVLIGRRCVEAQLTCNPTYNKPCPTNGNLEELYMEKSGDTETRMCCDSTSDVFETAKNQQKGCRLTECTRGSSGDLCKTFPERYVDGAKIDYDEIIRESCTKPGGSHGMIGYCCPKGSQEGQLATEKGAEENEFPHMAKFHTGPASCGATIYNKRFLVTAGHCVFNAETKSVHDIKPMSIVLGSNLGDQTSPEYTYGVKRAIPHPKYSKYGNDTRTFNDVALLELDRDIKFGDKVKALKIASKTFKPEDYATAGMGIGWGITDTLALSEHLQKYHMIIRTGCFEPNGVHSWIADKKDQLLCAGGVMDGVESPILGGGNSGGPLVCRGSDGKAVHCGIASFSDDMGNCLKNKNEQYCKPTGFVSVSYFRKWIKDTAGTQDESTLYRPYLFGEPVDWEDYEHQVHITSKDGKSCGGTLIKPDVVITAASCIISGDGSNTGKKGVKITSSSGQTTSMTKVAALAGYKRVGEPVNVKKQGQKIYMMDNYHKNDLVLIKLKDKMKVDASKLPSLPENNKLPEEAVEVSMLRDKIKILKMNATDQMVRRNFNILEHGECQARMNRLQRLGLNVKVDNNLLCGVEKYSSGSVCDRELGGGLLCQGKDGKNVLCGIQVFRLCQSSVPNGFLNMGLYQGWANQALESF